MKKILFIGIFMLFASSLFSQETGDSLEVSQLYGKWANLDSPNDKKCGKGLQVEFELTKKDFGMFSADKETGCNDGGRFGMDYEYDGKNIILFDGDVLFNIQSFKGDTLKIKVEDELRTYVKLPN